MSSCCCLVDALVMEVLCWTVLWRTRRGINGALFNVYVLWVLERGTRRETLVLSSTVCSSASTPVTSFHFEKGDCVNGLNRILSKDTLMILLPSPGQYLRECLWRLPLRASGYWPQNPHEIWRYSFSLDKNDKMSCLHKNGIHPPMGLLKHL